MKCFSVILLSVFAAVALAIENSYAGLTVTDLFSLIPSCSVDCKMDTLITDGCALDNFECHCSKWEYMQENTQPCLLSKSNCRLTELYEFVDIMTGVCAFYSTPSSLRTNMKRAAPSPRDTSKANTAVLAPRTLGKARRMTPAAHVSITALEEEL